MGTATVNLLGIAFEGSISPRARTGKKEFRNCCRVPTASPPTVANTSGRLPRNPQHLAGAAAHIVVKSAVVLARRQHGIASPSITCAHPRELAQSNGDQNRDLLAAMFG